MKKIIVLVVVSFIFRTAYCQSDSTRIRQLRDQESTRYLSLKRQIIPVSLISTGLIIEALSIKKGMQDAIPHTSTHVEDYIQYAPNAIMYGSDIAGVKHKYTVFNQTTYLVISEVTTSLLTRALKIITNETRPNGGSESFPSGHTSQAFSCASVLFNEFGDYNKPIACSGYFFSTATAVLRVTNNTHWVPDVLVGAGLAIVVTNIVYYFHPLKNWDPFHLGNKVSLIPDIDPGSKNLSMCVSFSPY